MFFVGVRMLYWKDNYYIESAAMDGTQRTLLINTNLYGRTCGLAVDSDGESSASLSSLHHSDDGVLVVVVVVVIVVAVVAVVATVVVK